VLAALRLTADARHLPGGQVTAHSGPLRVGRIATETAPEGWEVAADGFILRDDQDRLSGAASRLRKSPVKFIQTLMAIRRDGESFSKTHMGALLDGRLLQAEEFEE